MDSILSEFIARTSADPGLARDLLNAHEWNLETALSSYYVMKGILPGEVPLPQPAYSSKPSSASEIWTPKSTRSDDPPTSSSLKETSVLEEEDDSNKKLTRGFSRAMDNVSLISRARSEFAQDFGTLVQDDRLLPTKLEIPEYTFTLPDISVYPTDLREYLHRDLIETSTLVSLEQSGRLNWWYEKKICQKLWPLATTGDGNCLLHAASLGMWGFHDRLLTLRKALHSLLTSSTYTNSFYRRWRWQTSVQNKEAGLIYCEEEWEREWQNLLRMSSTEPRTKHLTNGECSSDIMNGEISHIYESLEELHVFGLAHVLRRPIIVIADTMLKDVSGEPFAPIPFGGIYLPLECHLSECHHSPLCLTYDAAHFSALVPMDSDGDKEKSSLKAAVPVLGPDNMLLPLHFAVDPGVEVKWGQDENDSWVVARLSLSDKDKLLLLNEYLDIRSFPVVCSDETCTAEPQKTVNNFMTEDKSEREYDSDEGGAGGISCTGGGRNHKSRAARQLQTVAKQFGSIGKSVSKKLKHIGDIARRGGSFKGESKAFRQVSGDLKNKRTLSGLPMVSNSTAVNGSCNPHQVIVALVHTEKKHEYQKEMIQNYLCSAVSRFEREVVAKGNALSSEVQNKGPVTITRCINPGCSKYGSSLTSYLCSECHTEQQQRERNREGNGSHSVLTFGKSSFYTESDQNMVQSLDKIPLVRGFSSKSYTRWNGNDVYDKNDSDINRIRPSTYPYDCKKRPSYIEDTITLNTVQESATS